MHLTTMEQLDNADPQDQARFIQSCALAWHQPDRLDEIAAAYGVDPNLITSALTDNSLRIEAMKELERMRSSGELIKALSLPVLEKFIKRAHVAMDDEAISPATLTRVADTTFKMAGLAEERASRLRRSEQKEAPMVVSVFSGRAEDAPPVPPGAHFLHIIAPPSAREKKPPEVVDGEVVDDKTE